jgi:hypothetical protein
VIPLSNFSDEDAQQVVRRSLRLLAVVTLLAVPLVWWKMDWRSAAMLAVGSAISGAGLWKWLRLMSVVIARMDTTGSDGKAHPMGSVLAGFFITLVLMLAALYVSLKFLDGSVYALAAGLAMGVFALTFEALRLVKAWTV